MELSTICEPIREELDMVEERLRSVSKVDFSRLSELLDYSLKGNGKRIRPILSLLSGKFYEYNQEILGYQINKSNVDTLEVYYYWLKMYDLGGQSSEYSMPDSIYR